MNYYERHLGDYARDTGHLSLLEHGVYTLLLDRYYATERPLPADLKAIYRLVRAREKVERAAVETVLEEFFELGDDGWHNRRCDQEITAYLAGQPEREEKRKNEVERKRRSRERRAEMFESLRAAGITVPWDATITELGRLCRQHGAPVTRDRRVTGPSPVTEPVTDRSRPVTATQTPDSKHQTPEEGSLRSPSDARAPVPVAAPMPDPGPQLSPDFEQFLDATYPATSHSRNVVDGTHRAQGLVGAGLLTEPQLRARLAGFRAFVDTGGISGPHRVPSLRNWLDRDHPERYWARDWAAVPTKAEQQQDANVDAAQAFLNRRRGQA